MAGVKKSGGKGGNYRDDRDNGKHAKNTVSTKGTDGGTKGTKDNGKPSTKSAKAGAKGSSTGAKAPTTKRAEPRTATERTIVRVRELDPYRKCGPGTSVERLIRVDEEVGGRKQAHLVYFDRHGWYCEHGRTCHAVRHARKGVRTNA